MKQVLNEEPGEQFILIANVQNEQLNSPKIYAFNGGNKNYFIMIKLKQHVPGREPSVYGFVNVNMPSDVTNAFVETDTKDCVAKAMKLHKVYLFHDFGELCMAIANSKF